MAWNEQTFVNVEAQKFTLFEELKELEGVEEIVFYKIERDCKIQLSVDCENVFLLEEIF